MQGIEFFCPSFEGSEREALAWIINHRIGPSVVAGSRFCEDRLQSAVGREYSQYLIFGAGYDTFSLRNENEALKVYELDLPEVLEDRKKRGTNGVTVECDLSSAGWSRNLRKAGYDRDRMSFSGLLGLTYYLTENELKAFLMEISEVSAPGSEICFDYQTCAKSQVTSLNEKLAAGAGEAMKGEYAYGHMKRLLSECGYLIYEHVNADQMNEMYFSHGRQMKALEGIAYVPAVKSRT